MVAVQGPDFMAHPLYYSHTVPCRRYLATSDHQMYSVRSLMNANSTDGTVLFVTLVLFPTPRVVITIFLYNESRLPDVLSPSGPWISSVMNAGSQLWLIVRN
jgi:hypothetical protein